MSVDLRQETIDLNKVEVRSVFRGLAQVLRPGGIFYISSKYSPEYAEELLEDRFGKWLFYYYNAEIMTKLASPDYETIEASQYTKGSTSWFKMALRKV